MGLRSGTMETVAPLPTLEALIEGKGTETAVEAPQVTETSKEDGSKLEQIERDQKHRRELFAREKRIKDLEAKLGDSGNKAGILEAKNPIKELAKQKGMNQDDLIKMALEAMDDDLTDTEKKADLKDMTPEAIAKLVREQLEAEKQKEANSQGEAKAVADFKVKIADKAKELAPTMPLVDALGGAESAFNMINEQFLKDVEEFGEEYASENMLSIDEAIKKTNDVLAKNVKDALQSKYLRDFILKTIKEDGLKEEKPNQSEEDNQLEDVATTLTNAGHRPTTEAGGKPKFSSDADELEHLINTLI